MVKIIFKELFWNKVLIIQMLIRWHTPEYSINSHFLSRMQVQNMSHRYYLWQLKDECGTVIAHVQEQRWTGVLTTGCSLEKSVTVTCCHFFHLELHDKDRSITRMDLIWLRCGPESSRHPLKENQSKFKECAHTHTHLFSLYHSLILFKFFINETLAKMFN